MLPSLPVTEALPALLDALAPGPNAVLVAPPGAGKTTLVPLALLDAPWRGDGRILVLEPRRLAARAAATPDGRAARRDGRAHRRLPHPAGQRRLRRDPDRGGHRGPAGPPPAMRPGARRRRRRAAGRGARARAGGRPGAGALPRPAARAAAGTAAAGHVGHARRRPPVRADGSAGDRERRPHVPGRDAATPPATSPKRATCRTPMARAVRAALAAARGRHPGFPAGHGRDPPDRGGAGRVRRAGPAAARRPAARRAGPRAAPGRGPPRRAGDQHRRDLAHRARRAHRRRWRLAAHAAARPGHRPHPARHPAHQPGRRRPARRPRRARGAGGGDPAMDHGAASRPAAVRPAGDPGGRTLRPRARLRRLGHAAGRAALPGPAARRRAGRGRAAARRARRAGRGGPHHPARAAAWPHSAPIRGSPR